MAKSKKPLTLQQQYVLEYASKQKDTVSMDTEKSANDIKEIGLSLCRIWGKIVRVIEWRDKWESVVVVIESGGGPDVPDGTVSTYKYPLHGNYFPFINFEVLEDCGYLEKFGNGDEYVIDGKRYGVKDDVIWAGGKRYLSSFEQVKYGSFRDFLAKHPVFTTKRTII